MRRSRNTEPSGTKIRDPGKGAVDKPLLALRPVGLPGDDFQGLQAANEFHCIGHADRTSPLAGKQFWQFPVA